MTNPIPAQYADKPLPLAFLNSLPSGSVVIGAMKETNEKFVAFGPVAHNPEVDVFTSLWHTSLGDVLTAEDLAERTTYYLYSVGGVKVPSDFAHNTVY